MSIGSIFSILSSLLGLLGSCLLALPYILRQKDRNASEIIGYSSADNPRIRRLLRDTKSGISQYLQTKMPVDIQYGLWGSICLALAFIFLGTSAIFSQ